MAQALLEPMMRWGFRRGAWDRLARELDAWAAAGLTATFWWRDDDAVDATPQLDDLLRRAGEVPIALSVIPALATSALATRLGDTHNVTVLQHGWRHAASPGGGPDEYGPHRPSAEVDEELAEGRTRLAALFGRQLAPVFVPPGHVFDAAFLPLLAPNGLRAISRKGPRPSPFVAPGLYQANAHVAPIRWSNPPSFAGDNVYLGQFVEHLRLRRGGRCDAEEATGLLTHHLSQDARSLSFVSTLVEAVSSHAAARWVSPETVFAPALAPAASLGGTAVDG
jgi:hypothetical protein